MKGSAPSLQTVADKAGVSRATASRALRNSPLVTQALKERVRQACKQVGYHPDSKITELMSHLRKRRVGSSPTETLAVITSMFYEKYLRVGEKILNPKLAGMQARAAELGFQIEVFHLATYGNSASRLNKVLWNRGIRGVIVDMLDLAHAELKLDWNLFSTVGTSFSLRSPIVHRVCHYYFHSMQITYQKLWQMGYRRIALHIDTRLDAVSDHNWIGAYLYERFQHGATDSLTPFFHEKGGDRAVVKWLNRNRPDAIITATSPRLFRDVLLRLGYDAPGDIGLAALHASPNDSEVAGIDQRMNLLGEVAVSTLAAQIVQNECGIPKTPVTHHVEGVWKNGRSVRRQKPEPASKGKPQKGAPSSN